MQSDNDLSAFLAGKSSHTLALFNYFISEYKKIGTITLQTTKTMIGIDNGSKRVAHIIKLGKDFVDVVFMSKQPYNNNLCFRKIAQVPGQQQYNHHFRLINVDDINDEMREFMKLAYDDNMQ
ncbi:MAG: hypothetical protein EOP46_15315 [Sphingobacteriaceae bacterium]|nr:MAG: hypothetical protein EOP46_15315 [Sphingobacteriaceae bacterium]